MFACNSNDKDPKNKTHHPNCRRASSNSNGKDQNNKIKKTHHPNCRRASSNSNGKDQNNKINKTLNPNCPGAGQMTPMRKAWLAANKEVVAQFRRDMLRVVSDLEELRDYMFTLINPNRPAAALNAIAEMENEINVFKNGLLSNTVFMYGQTRTSM